MDYLDYRITLGGNWAYRELGWGGYWAWDPVENASFMPWLLGTAYLHSVMIQEKRSMLKLWNLLLITLAFQFTLLGTFITRSGVISSVHSFAQSNVGWYFLGFIFATTARCHRHDGVSAEAAQECKPLGILALARKCLCLEQLASGRINTDYPLGTLWPILSEAINGEKASVPEAFFNRVVIIPGLPAPLLDRCRADYLVEEVDTEQFPTDVCLSYQYRCDCWRADMGISRMARQPNADLFGALQLRRRFRARRNF